MDLSELQISTFSIVFPNEVNTIEYHENIILPKVEFMGHLFSG